MKAFKVGNVKRRAAGAAMLDAIIPGRNKSGVDSIRPIGHGLNHKLNQCKSCTMCTS